ncbi:MAG: TOBE domain-containing protein, partial [Candidatus Latescibacteria bacterium]|nr:TOBE domain-containing protein [Candidatus Latescibacterota bacterium]
VAGFIGSPSMNFIRGTLSSNGSGMVFDEGSVQIDLPVGHGDQLGDHAGQEVTLGIRPEDIHDPDTIGRNVETVEIEAKVEVVEPMGNEVFLNLTTGKTAFVARVDPLHMPQIDQTVKLAVEIDKAHFFDSGSEKSLLQR